MPYLQVAMDLVAMKHGFACFIRFAQQDDHVIIEAGTPMIKQFGLSGIQRKLIL